MLTFMYQSRNVLKAVILMGLCCYGVVGKLRHRQLENYCQDLTNGISKDGYAYFGFSENTRCLLDGGKYCTATTIPPQNGFFKHVGQGCCMDWSDLYYDYVKYSGPLTVEGCESSCTSAMDQLGNRLRGFTLGNSEGNADCYCHFDDGVILSIPDGATSAYDENFGAGEVKSSSTWNCWDDTPECYRYLSRECPSTATPSPEHPKPIGNGCCISFQNQFYDFVYYTDLLTVEECESKCLSAMNEINSTLRGFQRGSTEEKSNCYCLFDDGVLTSVPNCASGAITDYSGTGEVKAPDTWNCYIKEGECYRFESTERALKNKTNNSYEKFVSTCMSKECDAAHEFFINGTMVDANTTLKDVSCMVSSCNKFEININRPYNDIAQVPSTDPSHCCDACRKETSCILFSWSKSQSLCYLKNSQGNTADDQDFISGYI